MWPCAPLPTVVGTRSAAATRERFSARASSLVYLVDWMATMSQLVMAFSTAERVAMAVPAATMLFVVFLS